MARGSVTFCLRVRLPGPYLAPVAGLCCIADEDEIDPPALGIEASRNAPAGELRRYPGGHFALLYGEAFELVVADELEFLERSLVSG